MQILTEEVFIYLMKTLLMDLYLRPIGKEISKRSFMIKLYFEDF